MCADSLVEQNSLLFDRYHSLSFQMLFAALFFFACIESEAAVPWLTTCIQW